MVIIKLHPAAGVQLIPKAGTKTDVIEVLPREKKDAQLSKKKISLCCSGEQETGRLGRYQIVRLISEACFYLVSGIESRQLQFTQVVQTDKNILIPALLTREALF